MRRANNNILGGANLQKPSGISFGLGLWCAGKPLYTEGKTKLSGMKI